MLLAFLKHIIQVPPDIQPPVNYFLHPVVILISRIFFIELLHLAIGINGK